MHGKPACYYDSSSLSGMKMEETIRKWLEDKLEDLELVERDLKKHVRTFVGIFRLSRQDLVQDIKEEPQYPLEVRRDMDGQYSLEDLRKSVFVFEFMKLTCLKKEEADRIVDELFTKWNLIAVEKLKEEKEDLAQKRPVSQPACLREPVSRSEQETSYTNAFPALPPKGNKPKIPSEPMPSFWEQRSPLRSNPSVQSSKSKIGLQDSSSEKASALSNKKIRIGGKENECGPACTEPKKKMNKNRDVRSRRESSSSSVQSPRSPEEQQHLEEIRTILKSYLRVNDGWEKAKASAESSKKKERVSRTLEASASTSEGKEQLNLNPTQNCKESIWASDYVTKYPSWSSQNGAEETASCTTQNQRSASEPHLAMQEQRIDCGLPKERTWTQSESTSSSPAPAQAAEPSMVDCLFKEILGNVNSPGFTRGSFDLQAAEPSMVQFNSSHRNLVDHLFKDVFGSPGFTGGLFNLNCIALNPIDHTSTTGIHSDGLFLSDSVWNRSHVSEKWPVGRDSHIPQGMNLQPATSVGQVQEKPENMASGCPSPLCCGHFNNFIDHNMQQNQELWFSMFRQPDSSEAKGDRWWHHQVDSSYVSDEEEATVSPDSDSWKLHQQEHPCFSFEDKSSTAQEQLELASASDFLNARQQSPAHAVEKNSQDTFQNAMSPSVIERAVDQIFPQHLSEGLNHDTEFQWDNPFSNHGCLHNHLPSMDSASFSTSCMLPTVQDCSLCGCVSDHYKQISSRLLCLCSFSHQSHSAQMLFPSHLHAVSFLEDATHSNHPQSEPYPKPCMWTQPSQSAGSGEGIGRKLFHGHSVLSALHHPVRANYPRKSEDDIDQLGIRSLASMLEKNCQKNWEECVKEQQSSLMENDLSGSPDLMGHSSFTVSSQQDFCSCEGACNCLSVLPVEFSLGGGEEVASDAIHPYKQQRIGQSCLQVSQNVMKSASDSMLSFHESAFRSVNGTGYPILALPSLPQIAYPFDTPSEKKTTPTCLIHDASEHQLEKIKNNSLRVIKPEVMKPEEPEEVAVPDLSILHHPDVYGNLQEKVQAMPSYPFLNFKESKETQTSHGDIESDALPSLSARPFPKPVYEEKHWKDLLPVSAEDEHRDCLFAALNAPIQEKGVESLDVAALEGYDFADFQLLTETSTSLHVPQNQAVYVKDLEKAWLSESYRRLGKNKVRRPLHPNKPCSFFLEGCCYRFDCKFSHDIDTITCQFWEVGQCFKGALCPFLHGYFGGSSGSEVGEAFDITKEAYPERSRKDVRLNSAPASKKRKNKKNSIHRLQLPRGT